MSIIEKVIEKAGEDKNSPENLLKKEALKNKQNIATSSPVVETVQKSVKHHKGQKNNDKSKSNRSNVLSINHKKLASLGFLSSEDTISQLSEEYRMIKRPLINNALNTNNNKIKHANLILVTSSQPGEGKTFTAINLALSIAGELDKKVLLIDADVAKPSISRVLEIEDNGHGLIDYLDGEDLDFSEMMIKTDIDGLSIIPAGKHHGYSTELLASERMAVLADELHSRYSDRIVIFDSPPLLATTQAEVLAGLVGQVVLVVEAENTLQSMVSDAIAKLKVCDVVLGLLNKSTQTVGLNYYGYGQYGH